MFITQISVRKVAKNKCHTLQKINCDIRILLIIYIDDLNVNCLKTRLDGLGALRTKYGQRDTMNHHDLNVIKSYFELKMYNSHSVPRL